MTELYDTIGGGYGRLRQPDPRIRREILRALEGVDRVVNVGAGTGSYEPPDRFVVAVEPSMAMIQQRPPRAAPAVQAVAGNLPFRDAAFDAALAILTLHHWPDWRRGLAELARATRKRMVILTWDPSAGGFWLINDYFPEILAVDRRVFPSVEAIGRELGRVAVSALPIPSDCTDGFLGAYWQRPRAYLSPSVRNAISVFGRLGSVQEGLGRLDQDLESGEWHRRYGTLLTEASLDVGYRLIVSASG